MTPSAPSSTPTSTSAPTPSSPTVSSSPAPSAPAGLDSTIDSLLATPNGASDPPTSDTSASPDAAAPAQPTPEAPKTEEPVVVAPEEPDNEDDADLDSGMADQAKPNLLDLKQPRGKRIYGAYKAYKAITEAMGGEEPTVDALVNHRAAYSDKLAMEYDFMSGDPTNARNFVHNWNQASPQGMQSVAAQLPDYLAASNKDAYMSMAMPVMQRFIATQYALAKAEQNPEVQKAKLYMTQMLDWTLNDKFQALDAASGAQGTLGAGDPLADERAAISRERAEISQWQQQQVAASQNQWLQELAQAQNSALATEADKIFEPTKDSMPARVAKALRADFIEAVNAHLAKDVEGNRIYELSKNSALSRRSREDLGALGAQFAQRVSRAARAVAPSFLKEAGIVAKQQSDKRHEALAASSAAGAAPVAGGVVHAPSVTGQNGQFASKGDAFDAILNGALGVKVR